ncbi:MAG: hypothetical protein M1830_009897, partial [Pleopsidium flavum]
MVISRPESDHSTNTDMPGTSLFDLQTAGLKDGDNQRHPMNDLERNPEKGETPAAKVSAFKSLGLLDRFLALWILLAMAIGIILGNFVPNTSPALQRGQFVGVSLPIAIGLLIMMYPILCKVKYETLHHVFRKREVWIQILFSVVVNWLIALLLMLALAWAFLPDKPGLREGLII